MLPGPIKAFLTSMQTAALSVEYFFEWLIVLHYFILISLFVDTFSIKHIRIQLRFRWKWQNVYLVPDNHRFKFGSEKRNFLMMMPIALYIIYSLILRIAERGTWGMGGEMGWRVH